jgi:hypothetical protein
VTMARENENQPWVRIASSVLSASNLFPFSKPLAESTLEAMRTQGLSAGSLILGNVVAGDFFNE